MRSVAIHFRSAQPNEIAACLDQMYPRQQHPWVHFENDDAVLYINIVTTSEAEDLTDYERAAFDRAPSCSVYADVSGRHRGDAQVHLFVTTLLKAFDGVAVDDFSERVWALGELLDGSKHGGLSFFDYLTYYAQHPVPSRAHERTKK